MDLKKLSIKAYLNKEEEIRRFYVDISDCKESLYLLILDRVCVIFEISSTDTVKLSWKDSDGDFVTFSSDEELALALVTVPENGEFKLYVTYRPRQDLTGAVHAGIVCNECECLVYGRRYHCLECSNFDLCSSCVSRGTHREHTMIVIPRPECLQNAPWVLRKRGPTSFRGRRSMGPGFSRCPAASDDSEFMVSEGVRERMAALGLGDQASGPASLSASQDSAVSQVDPMQTVESSGGFVMVNDTNVPSFDPLPFNIQASLNQMKTMGFVDERGWLTKMLLKYNGDIPKCLDEIQRRTK